MIINIPDHNRYVIVAFILLIVIFPNNRMRCQTEAHSLPLDGSNAEYEFLNKSIEGKTILFLGENSHEVSEYISLKTKLASYLFQTAQFNIFALESSFSNCYVAGQLRHELTAREMTNLSIYEQFRSDEYLEFMAMLQENEGLLFLGIDNQERRLDTIIVVPYIARQIRELNPTFADEYLSIIPEFKKHTAISPIGQPDSFKLKGEKIIARINNLNNKIASAENVDPFLIRHLENLTLTLQQWGFNRELDGIAFRDSAMAENILWIMSSFPEAKLICSGHNVHISKDVHTKRYRESAARLVREALPNQTYHVGIYGYSGAHGHPVMTLDKVKKNLLEHRLNALDFEICFVPVNEREDWMNKSIPTINMGYYPEKVIPSKAYDAIIQFKKISPIKLLN